MSSARYKKCHLLLLFATIRYCFVALSSFSSVISAMIISSKECCSTDCCEESKCLSYRDTRLCTTLSTFLNKVILSFFRIDWIVSLLSNMEGSIFFPSEPSSRVTTFPVQWCFSLHLKLFWFFTIQPWSFPFDISSPEKTSNHNFFYNFQSLLRYHYQKPHRINHCQAFKVE